jgi:hypothetical protein
MRRWSRSPIQQNHDETGSFLPVSFVFGRIVRDSFATIARRARSIIRVEAAVVGPALGAKSPMDVIEGIIRACVTLAVILIVIGAIAALFMIVFGIATGIDDRIQD